MNHHGANWCIGIKPILGTINNQHDEPHCQHACYWVVALDYWCMNRIIKYWYRFLDVLLHAIIKFHRQRYVFAVLWLWISMVWCWSNRKLKSNPFSTLLVLIWRPMTRICVNYIDNDLLRLNDCHRHVYYINPEVKSMQSKIEYSMVVFLFTALETKS